jgi:hypothetical protein
MHFVFLSALLNFIVFALFWLESSALRAFTYIEPGDCSGPDMIFFSCFKFCVTVNTQKNTIDTGIIGGIVMLFGSDRSAQEHPGLPYRGHHSSAVRMEGGGSKRGWQERGMERSPHTHTQYECSLSFPTSFSKPRCPTSTDLSHSLVWSSLKHSNSCIPSN